MAKRSKEQLNAIAAHARVSNIESLLDLSQIDGETFIETLQKVLTKVNYLQELMVAKIFTNSIEISKAITFMNELRMLHDHFCDRARLFAKEQGEILS